MKNLLKGVVRAAGALVGSQIGGPAGAGLGAALATRLTGGSNRDALLGGVVSGLGAYGLDKFGGKLGLSTEGQFSGGTPGSSRGIANFATSPAGLSALALGTAALSPSDPAPASGGIAPPVQDSRSLEQMGYDVSPLQRQRQEIRDDPYAYGETGGERRYFVHGGRVRRGRRYADGGDVDAPDFSGYDTSSIEASQSDSAPTTGPSSDFNAGYDAGVTAPDLSNMAVNYGTAPSTAAFPSGPPGGYYGAPTSNAGLGGLGGIFQRGADAVRDAANNPGRTVANAAINYNPIGLIANLGSRALTGESLGAHVMGAIQSITGYGRGGTGAGYSGNSGADEAASALGGSNDYHPDQTGLSPADPSGVSYIEAPQFGPTGAVEDGVHNQQFGPMTPVPAAASASARVRVNPAYDPLRYGEAGGESRFYAARGGLARGVDYAAMAQAAYDRGGPVSGPGSGQDDKVPAMLSDGEFVWSASDVSDLGEGSNAEGARRLETMRRMIRKKAGRKNVKQIAGRQHSIGSLMRSAGG